MKPSYQICTGGEIREAITALRIAEEFITESIPYTDPRHACHADAVSDCNRITSSILTLDEMLNRWEAE